MERYEVYKDSGVGWIDAIPVEWDVVPLKSLFAFGKGLPITKADLVDEGVPVISYGQIHSKANTPAHIDDSLIRFVPESFLESNPMSLTEQGDFLFADTSEDVDGSGSFVYHDRVEKVFAGYHTLILSPRNRAHGRYLSYLFQSDEWKSQIRSRVSGVKLFSLTQRILGDVCALLPPHSVQVAIADYLDARTVEVDALIADCEREVELLREYRKAVISEAVTKGLDPDVPMKDSGVEWIGEIPEGWDTARTKQVCCKITDGSHFSPSIVEEGYPYITATNIRGRGIDYDSAKLIDEDAYNLLVQNGCRPRLGDVLMVKDGATTGRAGIMIDDEPCVILSSVAMMRPLPICNSDYLFYCIQSKSFQEQVLVSMAGSAMPRTTLDKLVEYCITLPPVHEQIAISSYLDAKIAEIDSLIEAKQAMADKLREYRKSLITEAVTGKFKVPGVK